MNQTSINHLKPIDVIFQYQTNNPSFLVSLNHAKSCLICLLEESYLEKLLYYERLLKARYLLVYQKILVPVDGSDHSKRALQEAIKLARMTQGTITLVHVTPGKHSGSQPVNHGQSILDEGKKFVQTEGVQAETLLLEGKVVEDIVRVAKEGVFDLIIIGARGLSKFEELVLGSVSHGVTEKAPCPVIVTR
jgi:nucleotide-binding universal stress UspA family protein